MLDVFWIVLMFTGAASGLPSQDPVICTFTDSKQCHVAVGQRLHLQMLQMYSLTLTFTDRRSTERPLLKYRPFQSNPSTPSDPRWQFVNDNKTMILNKAERSDSGTYKLKLDDDKGTFIRNYSLPVNIEGGPPENLIEIVLSLLCVILIVLSGIAFYIYKKKHGLKDKEAPSQDGKELPYAEVTHLPTDKTKSSTTRAQPEAVEYATVITGSNQSNQKKKEDEVPYGELVFNDPAEKKSEMPKVKEECVYSQVKHGQ